MTVGFNFSSNTVKRVILFSKREKMKTLLHKGLSQEKYTTFPYSNINELFESSIDKKPGLILLDITSSNREDMLIIRRLRSDKATVNIPILVLFAEKHSIYFNKLKEFLGRTKTGEQLYFLKHPVSFTLVLRTVQVILLQNLPKDDDTLIKASQFQTHRHESTISKLLDKNLTPREKMDLLFNEMEEKWAFPFTIIKALNLLDSTRSTTKELAKCITTDTGATSAILKVANTVEYSKGSSTTSIQEAVTRIGFETTKKLLSGFVLLEFMSEDNSESEFTNGDFWFHSLATALITKKILTRWKHPQPDVGFIAGLIHDIGKVSLKMIHPSFFNNLVKMASRCAYKFHNLEKEKIGFSHDEFGAFLCERWNLQTVVSSALRYHHSESITQPSESSDEHKVFLALYLADIYAKGLSFGRTTDSLLPIIPSETFGRQFSIPVLEASFFSSIENDLFQIAGFLDISIDRNFTIPPKTFNNKPKTLLFITENETMQHPLFYRLHQMKEDIEVTHTLPENNIVQRYKGIIHLSDKKYSALLNSWMRIDDGNTKKLIITTEEFPRELPHRVTIENFTFLDRNSPKLFAQFDTMITEWSS